MILSKMRFLIYSFLLFHFFSFLSGFKPEEIHLKIAQGALEQVGVTIYYAPGYTRLKYPNGDIQMDRGYVRMSWYVHSERQV